MAAVFVSNIIARLQIHLQPCVDFEGDISFRLKETNKKKQCNLQQRYPIIHHYKCDSTV